MSYLRFLYSKLYQRARLIRLLLLEKQYLQKYNGSFSTDSDPIKLENLIRISVHAIEKGFSFRTTKPAFGVGKIIMLLDMIDKYSKFQGAKEKFVLDCLSTIKYYIDVNEDNQSISEIKSRYLKIASKYHGFIVAKDTVIEILKKDVDNCLNKVYYESFIASRHSYRYFSSEPVDNSLLKQAFKIAEYTPTACNRQAQRVYVFSAEKKDMLLNVGPSRGFVSEVDTAILVTVDMRAYFGEEFYQCYVDGGLYAMNLINAIHSTGLGCIPLTAGMYAVQQRKELCDKLHIPINEAPIITIGVGNREERTRVNASYRKSYTEYVTWK